MWQQAGRQQVKKGGESRSTAEEKSEPGRIGSHSLSIVQPLSDGGKRFLKERAQETPLIKK